MASSTSAADQIPQEGLQETGPDHVSATNPGPFDALHNDVRGILPSFMVFQGARFSFQKPVGQRLALTHNLVLNGAESTYRLQTTYIGALRQKGAQEAYPICIGDVNHEGKLSANIIHELSDNVKLKYQLQTDGSKVVGTALESEYHGVDYCAGLKVLNYNPAKSRGTWILNYLQKVNSRIALGAEFQYQHTPELAEYSGLNFGGRYSGDKWSLSGTLSPIGIVQTSYIHNISQNVTAACELEMQLLQRQAQASIGAKYQFRTSTFRAQITSGGAVMGFFEKRLAPAFTFVISAVLDHATSDTTFGMALNIGQ